MNTQNAHFYYFRASGKYYTDGRGCVPHSNAVWSREELLACNDFKMPGLSTTAEDLVVVVVPEGAYGWPQLKLPQGVDTPPELG